MRTKWTLLVFAGICFALTARAKPSLENLFGFYVAFEDKADVRRALDTATLGVKQIAQIGDRKALERLHALLERVLALPAQVFLPEEAWNFSIALKSLLQMENLSSSDMTMIGVLGESPPPIHVQDSDLAPLYEKLLALTKRCLEGQSLREQLWLLLQMTEDHQSAPLPEWVPVFQKQLPAGHTLVDNLKLVIAHAYAMARPKAIERERSLGGGALPHEQLMASYVQETLITYFEMYREMLLALPTGRVSLLSHEETDLLWQSFDRQATRAGQIHWQYQLEGLWQKLFGRQTRSFWPECGAAVAATWKFLLSPLRQRPKGSRQPL